MADGINSVFKELMCKFFTSHTKFSEQWVVPNRTVITGWNVTFYSSASVCPGTKTHSTKLDVKKIVSNHSGDKTATHITWTVCKYEDPLFYKVKTVHPVHIYRGCFIMYSGITKIYYRKTVGHVFTKPVQIERIQKFFFPVSCFSS
jgi:hypothetical protein